MKNQVTLNKPFKLEYQTDKHNVNDITQGLALRQTEKAVFIQFPKRTYSNGIFTIAEGVNSGITLQGKSEWSTVNVTAWIPKSIFCNLDNWFDCDVTDEYGNLLKNENQFKCFELPYFITINEKQQ